MGAVRSQDDSSHLFAQEISHKLLVVSVAIKVNFVILTRIVLQNLGNNLGLGPATENYLVYAHFMSLSKTPTIVHNKRSRIGPVSH